FEKALDPENTVPGLARTLELLQQVCPGVRTSGGISDSRAQAQPTPPIPLSTEFVARKLGVPVTQAQIAEILSALGFSVQESAPEVLTVIVPSWRATKDISLKDDLVEEIGRMIGYGEITPTPPTVAAIPPPANPARSYRRQVRFQLAAQGFTEVYNYSFLNEADVKKFSLPIAEHLAVRNPIASELTHLRRSLLPGLFENVVSNTRHSPDFRIFEIGSEIHPSSGTDLPKETVHLAAGLYNLHANVGDLFELKRVLECLFPGVRLRTTTALPYEHPTRTAEAEWHGAIIGRIFEIHPSLLRAEGIEGRAMFFDVDLARTQELQSRRTKMYRPLRKYPTSGFDLSIIADLRTPVASIENDLRSLAGESLASLEFVTEYSGPPFPEGRKSVSYHLEVGSLDHTLTADEVAEIRGRIIEGMRNRGYGLRV
ncbi:MAG: phenylalanyl-tRNA synthetase beta subunit, partial [Bryobacterales bacterium]|nr:phenylalanyl-tRNA synthetase beta subunit [Bryobacterales bacterium]